MTRGNTDATLRPMQVPRSDLDRRARARRHQRALRRVRRTLAGLVGAIARACGRRRPPQVNADDVVAKLRAAIRARYARYRIVTPSVAVRMRLAARNSEHKPAVTTVAEIRTFAAAWVAREVDAGRLDASFGRDAIERIWTRPIVEGAPTGE